MEVRGRPIFGRSEQTANEHNCEALLDGVCLGVTAERDSIPVELYDWREAEEVRPLQRVRPGLSRSSTSLLTCHEPVRDAVVSSVDIFDPEEHFRGLTEAAAKWFSLAISWGRLKLHTRELVSDASRTSFESTAEVNWLWSTFVVGSDLGHAEYLALLTCDSASIDSNRFSLPRACTMQIRKKRFSKPFEI
jgi:hypothetical protein